METTSKSLLKEALELPKDDRAEIAQQLLLSLEPQIEPEIDQAWRNEVAHRMAQYDAGELKSVPWEEVRDALRSRQHAKKAS